MEIVENRVFSRVLEVTDEGWGYGLSEFYVPLHKDQFIKLIESGVSPASGYTTNNQYLLNIIKPKKDPEKLLVAYVYNDKQLFFEAIKSSNLGYRIFAHKTTIDNMDENIKASNRSPYNQKILSLEEFNTKYENFEISGHVYALQKNDNYFIVASDDIKKVLVHFSSGSFDITSYGSESDYGAVFDILVGKRINVVSPKSVRISCDDNLPGTVYFTPQLKIDVSLLDELCGELGVKVDPVARKDQKFAAILEYFNDKTKQQPELPKLFQIKFNVSPSVPPVRTLTKTQTLLALLKSVLNVDNGTGLGGKDMPVVSERVSIEGLYPAGILSGIEGFNDKVTPRNWLKVGNV